MLKGYKRCQVAYEINKIIRPGLWAHSLKLKGERTRFDLCKFALWNGLPAEVVTASMMTAFETQLKTPYRVIKAILKARIVFPQVITCILFVADLQGL